jgi:hypothetical protein
MLNLLRGVFVFFQRLRVLFKSSSKPELTRLRLFLPQIDNP